jgi:beta-lactamase class A
VRRRPARAALRLAATALVAACAAPPPVEPPRPAPAPIAVPTPLDDLERRMKDRIAQHPHLSVGVALIDLATGLRVEINAYEPMHAASTMKVPVLLELFRRADVGMLSLDDSVTVHTQFRSLVGDTLYALRPQTDSDSTLYARAGGRASLRSLARLMIVRSSNLATNLLLERVPAADVMATMARIGAPDMVVRRGVEDGPAFRLGLNNTATAEALATVLEAIGRCTVASRAACDAMLEILSAQEFRDAIPAGLPAGTRVAHKTGWITGIQHDGAIVLPAGRPPYVLVILMRGVEDRAEAARLGAELSRMAWETLVPGPFAALGGIDSPLLRSVLQLQIRHRVDAIARRAFTHAELWRALDPHLGGPVEAVEVGRSVEGRAIRLLKWGDGPTRVLLWSQMHGDESTATMALADLVRYLHEARGEARARRWAERLTILVMPMLNPDGAERFVRHNAVGIDINRDARALATPEGRALKEVHDRFRPDFGFNLHDQNPRTRVGAGPATAAIALLAPPFDSTRAVDDVRRRAMHVAAVFRDAVEPLVGGRITQYDDAFNPRAFGDLTTQWGTSTVLVESGGWRRDPQKQFLRTVNFVGLVAALDAIAEDRWADADVRRYTGLPRNGRALNDLLIRGGAIVLPGATPVAADVVIDYEDEGGRRVGARIVEVGDLAGTEAHDTIDATGLFLHVRADTAGALLPLPRSPAAFVIRRGADPDSEPVWVVENGAARRVPRPR